MRVDNVSRAVDGALCADAGLEAPVTIQRCGLTECPHWNFDEWSPCETSRCFTLHYGLCLSYIDIQNYFSVISTQMQNKMNRCKIEVHNWIYE